MLTKTTHKYAKHIISLSCDIYGANSYPSNKPVFLFFHSGGLICGSRDCVPPWLVQACFQRKWPLICPSYRLLPQAGGSGLVDDALAAYDFAQSWKATGAAKRPVIVGGASAGFFMANLVAHHVKQAPLPKAMLCITGIPSFHHQFFKSSVLLTPQPIKDEEAEPFVNGPLMAGTIPDAGDIFSIDQLLPSGLKNPNHAPPSSSATAVSTDALDRGCLYDYYLYQNAYLDLIGAVDPGFEWARQEPKSDRFREWPPTTFIQGDTDPDVSMDVTTYVVDLLGPQKATLCLAENQAHLFERKSYLEDEGEAMDVVRQALASLDKQVSEMEDTS